MIFISQYISGKCKYLVLFNPFVFVILIMMVFQNTGFSQESEEPGKKFYFNVNADLISKYLWRGLVFSKGYVIQPSVTAGYDKFSAYLWCNIEPGLQERSNLNEVNASIIYSTTYKNLTIEPSLLFYTYPGEPESPSTGEFMLKLSYPLHKWFSMFTTHNLDIIRYHGSYVGDAGILFEYQYNKRLTVDASSALGWSSAEFNKLYHNIDRGALSILDLTASLTLNVTKHFYLRPRTEIQIILDKEIKESSGEKDIYNVGISIGVDF